MDAAKGNGAPPPVLKIAWMCEKWNRLPDDGSPLEQDYILMRQMTISQNIYNAVTRWYSLEGKAIHSLSDGERSILKMLKDMGLMLT